MQGAIASASWNMANCGSVLCVMASTIALGETSLFSDKIVQQPARLSISNLISNDHKLQ